MYILIFSNISSNICLLNYNVLFIIQFHLIIFFIDYQALLALGSTASKRPA